MRRGKRKIVMGALLGRPSWHLLALVNDDMANREDERHFTSANLEQLRDVAVARAKMGDETARELLMQLNSYLAYAV